MKGHLHPSSVKRGNRRIPTPLESGPESDDSASELRRLESTVVEEAPPETRKGRSTLFLLLWFVIPIAVIILLMLFVGN